jgi:hypothetical protein
MERLVCAAHSINKLLDFFCSGILSEPKNLYGFAFSAEYENNELDLVFYPDGSFFLFLQYVDDWLVAAYRDKNSPTGCFTF